MTFTGRIYIVVCSVRFLVVLIAIFQNVITVLLACTPDILTVSAGKSILNDGIRTGSTETDVQMSVVCIL